MKVVLSENQLKKLILETKKEEFNRTSFYLDYYKNLTPSNFDIAKKGNEIIRLFYNSYLIFWSFIRIIDI
jgi:hypothetical protein